MEMRETLYSLTQKALDDKDVRLYYALACAIAEVEKLNNTVVIARLQQYHGSIIRKPRI